MDFLGMPEITPLVFFGLSAASLVTSRSLVVRLVKLIRDYGAIITVIALVIALWPAGTLWLTRDLLLFNPWPWEEEPPVDPSEDEPRRSARTGKQRRRYASRDRATRLS